MKKNQENNIESAELEQGSQNMPEGTEPFSNAANLVTELTNDLQRTRADFENYRKQTEIQKTQAIAMAKSATIRQVLPLIDDFSRAIMAYPEQLRPLEKNLQKTLDSLGIKVIDSLPGTGFNPDLHEAVSVSDDGGEVEVISETLRPGYMYDGAVIRAAMVKVSRIADPGKKSTK